MCRLAIQSLDSVVQQVEALIHICPSVFLRSPAPRPTKQTISAPPAVAQHSARSSQECTKSGAYNLSRSHRRGRGGKLRKELLAENGGSPISAQVRFPGRKRTALLLRRNVSQLYRLGQIAGLGRVGRENQFATALVCPFRESAGRTVCGSRQAEKVAATLVRCQWLVPGEVPPLFPGQLIDPPAQVEQIQLSARVLSEGADIQPGLHQEDRLAIALGGPIEGPELA